MAAAFDFNVMQKRVCAGQGNAIMASTNRLAVLVAATGLCLSVVGAEAQEVLACYTLHNDLVNFDRRAHAVDHYFMPPLKAAREALGADAYYQPCTINTPAGVECSTPNPHDAARYRYWRSKYDRSPLGGSDVIRLRIIDQMVQIGCPLPPEALPYGGPYGVRSRANSPHEQAVPPVIHNK
jgi:hypothetical protein